MKIFEYGRELTLTGLFLLLVFSAIIYIVDKMGGHHDVAYKDWIAIGSIIFDNFCSRYVNSYLEA